MQFDLPIGALRLSIGQTSVFWLPAAQQIPEAHIDQYLHEHEHAEISLMKATARRFEYRRTRFLVRHLTGFTEALPRDNSGVPSWPPGLTGSITHKNGAVGVTLASSNSLYGLGIDAEDLQINLALESRILSAREIKIFNHQDNRQRQLAIAFAFKEALFKACYPKGRIMFYFHDAEILELDSVQQTITARLLKDVGEKTPSGSVLTGRFLIHQDVGANGTIQSYVICTVRIPG